MPVAWDTTLVSRLRPACAELATFRRLIDSEDSPLIPAPALAEAAFGRERSALQDSSTRNLAVWLARLIREPEVRVLPLSPLAAIVAGRLRARAPFPPVRRRLDRRSKPERRVAWINDIAIAATAWGVGVPVATENVEDFERIAELLAQLYPRAIRLEVRPSPL